MINTYSQFAYKIFCEVRNTRKWTTSHFYSDTGISTELDCTKVYLDDTSMV